MKKIFLFAVCSCLTLVGAGCGTPDRSRAVKPVQSPPVTIPVPVSVPAQSPSPPSPIAKPTEVKPVANLLELYKQKPRDEDLAQIQRDFSIRWIDRSSTSTWPVEFDFDQSSLRPSKTVILSRLNILKHQRFSEPLPFTTLSAYDYIKKHTQNISLYLDCRYNSDGGGSLFLNVGSGHWTAIESGTCRPIKGELQYNDMLYLLMHEARHSEPGDPGHVSCGIPGGNDQRFENGSGFAYSAMYQMWVYKYSLNDPPEVKERAKMNAMFLLKERFCEKPKHSNPKVQAIIDELLTQSQ